MISFLCLHTEKKKCWRFYLLHWLAVFFLLTTLLLLISKQPSRIPVKEMLAVRKWLGGSCSVWRLERDTPEAVFLSSWKKHKPKSFFFSPPLPVSAWDVFVVCGFFSPLQGEIKREKQHSAENRESQADSGFAVSTQSVFKLWKSSRGNNCFFL